MPPTYIVYLVSNPMAGFSPHLPVFFSILSSLFAIETPNSSLPKEERESSVPSDSCSQTAQPNSSSIHQTKGTHIFKHVTTTGSWISAVHDDIFTQNCVVSVCILCMLIQNCQFVTEGVDCPPF